MKNICLLCKSENVSRHACGMLRCRACRFFFLSPEVRKEQQATFHEMSEQEIDQEHLAWIKKKYPKDSALKHKLYENYAVRAIKWYGDSITALDIGSSGGFFLRELEKLGAHVENLETCEVDPAFVQIAEEYYGYKGGIGNIETYNPGKTYDLLSMFDVLEHVDDFWGALSNMHALLKPNGRLILKLPNGRWAYLKYRVAQFFGFSKQKLGHYLHIRPGGHLNYWDFRTISRITRDQYEIESFEYARPTRDQFRNKFIVRMLGYQLDALLKLNLFPEMIVTLKKK